LSTSGAFSSSSTFVNNPEVYYFDEETIMLDGKKVHYQLEVFVRIPRDAISEEVFNRMKNR
jgi:hypothetical protein